MKDRVAINSISQGLEAFRSDLGFYPSSSQFPEQASNIVLDPLNIVTDTNFISPPPIDQGAHKLYEALVGLDGLGYQKDHFYGVEDGTQGTGLPLGTPFEMDKTGTVPVESKRKSLYVTLDDLAVGTMQECHIGSSTFTVNKNKNPMFVSTAGSEEPKPILYYKANPNGRQMMVGGQHPGVLGIYNYNDNARITQDTNGNGILHPVFDIDNGATVREFEIYIWNSETGVDINNNNPNLEAKFSSLQARPYNPDSYILINAGVDGQYGTEDDITNFK